MQLVEQHIIRKGDIHWSELDRVCFYSKNVYNAGMYRVRQHFLKTGKYLNYYAVEKHFKKKDLLPDQDLPANTVQQTLKTLDKAWISFFKALKAYQSNPNRFTGRPKMPRYKDTTTGRCVVTYTTHSISKLSIKQGIIKLSGLNIEIKTKINVDQINQVRIVPHTDYYTVEVVYTYVPEKQPVLDKNKIIGIDLGVDNIATLTSNQPGFIPFLVNGRVIKSINQWYNKQLSWLQSQLKQGQHTSKRIRNLTFKRNQRIIHHLHTISTQIILLMVERGYGILVVGKNDGWKQQVNIGAVNNQNFVQIPHSRFIDMLRYKAELAGITLVETEESYTSKCSFLDNESLEKCDVYAGRRVKRSLFVSNSGVHIHADVNGSYNIIRKVFPNAFTNAGGIEAFAVTPVRINIRTY